MYGMGINPGSSAIHELLTAFFSFTQGLLDAELGQECSPDQARTAQLKKDAKVALDGQDFTIIIATPYGNDLQWKARFDEFYRQDQGKIKMSQAMVLKDFDATSIEKGLIFSCNDFGSMTTQTKGTDTTEKLIVFLNPIPWMRETRSKDNQYPTNECISMMGVPQRQGVVQGLWVLSEKGLLLNLGASPPQLPIMEVDQDYALPKGTVLSEGWSGPTQDTNEVRVAFSMQKQDRPVCNEIIAKVLRSAPGLKTWPLKSPPGTYGLALRPKLDYETADGLDETVER